MILGITGKVGSGKTFCTEYIKENYNAIVFSCDEIAKDIIEKKVTDYVPITPLDFFKDEKAQKECREKIHPLVFKKLKYYINEYKNIDNNNILIIIEFALPSEKLYSICDKVIYIENSFDDKVNILKNKRGYSEEITRLIYDSQKYYDKFYNKADFRITNNKSKNDLEKKIKEVIDEIYFIRK